MQQGCMYCSRRSWVDGWVANQLGPVSVLTSSSGSALINYLQSDSQSLINCGEQAANKAVSLKWRGFCPPPRALGLGPEGDSSPQPTVILAIGRAEAIRVWPILTFALLSPGLQSHIIMSETPIKALHHSTAQPNALQRRSGEARVPAEILKKQPLETPRQSYKMNDQSDSNQSESASKWSGVSQKIDVLSLQEKDKLFMYQASFGNKWAKIANLLNKNINTVKNYFYGTIRRGLRKMNLFMRSQKPRREKRYSFIKTTVIMKLMEVLDDKFSRRLGVPDKLIETCESIKQLLIEASKQESEEDQNLMEELRKQLQGFNKSHKRRRRERFDTRKVVPKHKKRLIYPLSNKMGVGHLDHSHEGVMNQALAQQMEKQTHKEDDHPKKIFSKAECEAAVCDSIQPSLSSRNPTSQFYLNKPMGEANKDSQQVFPSIAQFAVHRGGSSNGDGPLSPFLIGWCNPLQLCSTEELIGLYNEAYSQIFEKTALCNNIAAVLEARLREHPSGFPDPNPANQRYF